MLGTPLPRPVWRRELPAPFVTLRPQLYNDPQKSDEWLARRTEQTASPAAANVGLSPYPRADPVTRWGEMTGLIDNPFRGNIYTDYGNRYEDRVRAICRAMLHTERVLGGGAAPAIVEWGMFRDRVRRHLGISPDGETDSLRIVGTLDDGRAVDWTLGKMMVEIKTSRNHSYETPRIPHMTQIQLQMHVMGRHWGILHYWSCDHTRAWLVRHDRFGFCKWMMRRLDLMHEHTARRVPVTDTNPWFAFRTRPVGARRYPGAPPATVADWLQQEWYSESKRTGAPLRAPLTTADWHAELELLGMTEAEWAARYEDTLPRGNDAGMQATPPQPEAYQIYEYERPLSLSDTEFTDDRCVPDVDTDNMDWFCSIFPSAAEWAATARDRPPPPDIRMPRLFIDAVYSAPEHDETPPVDGRDDDTPEERAAYEERLAALRAKRAAEAARVQPTLRELFSRPVVPLAAGDDTDVVMTPCTPSSPCALSPPSPNSASGVKRAYDTESTLAAVAHLRPDSPLLPTRIDDIDATPPPSPRVKRRSPDVVLAAAEPAADGSTTPKRAAASALDDDIDATPPPSPRVKRRPLDAMLGPEPPAPLPSKRAVNAAPASDVDVIVFRSKRCAAEDDVLWNMD